MTFLTNISRDPLSEWLRPLDFTSAACRSIVFSAGVLFLVGAAVIGLQEWGLSTYRLILWGAAFSLIGLVLGFIFCIPRDGARTVNNNLVDISDWLTKIIVGIGLTELHSLPESINRLTIFMAGTGDTPTFSQSAAGATLLYFGAHGFFHGYILTRLGLNVLFAETTRKLSEILGLTEQKKLIEDSLPTESTVSAELQAQADPQLRAIAAVPIDQLTSPQECLTWSKANLKLGNYPAAVDGYTRVVTQLPDDARVAAELGIALFKATGKPEAAYAQLLRARDLLGSSPELGLRRDVFKWLAYVSLYREKPAGYQDSIRFANEYLAPLDAKPSAGLFINKACAHGQEYSDEIGKPTPSRPLVSIETDALKALQRALTVRPDYREHVARLLHGDLHGDDDLIVFKGRPAFEALASNGVIASELENRAE